METSWSYLKCSWQIHGVTMGIPLCSTFYLAHSDSYCNILRITCRYPEQIPTEHPLHCPDEFTDIDSLITEENRENWFQIDQTFTVNIDRGGEISALHGK